MYEVPVGTAVGVRVTNNASDGVFEYTVVKQPPPAPPEIDFIANAAFTECDAPVPFNEYWGKSTAGATITISSPYGGGQTTSNGEGKWAARIEFPGAPVGETFDGDDHQLEGLGRLQLLDGEHPHRVSERSERTVKNGSACAH